MCDSYRSHVWIDLFATPSFYFQVPRGALNLEPRDDPDRLDYTLIRLQCVPAPGLTCAQIR